MGQTRVIAALALCLAGVFRGAIPSEAAQSRFVAYGNEQQCVADRILAAPVCATAFGRAQAEFEAKTPSFPTAAACGASFRDCMAWPPGAARPAGFRPRWAGVEIVDTPGEKTATPTLAGAGRKISFAPQSLTATPRPLVVHGPLSFPTRPVTGQTRQARGPERPLGPSAPPPPGSGFKLEDGVLTYPAPARFQPKNLPPLK